MSGRLAVFTKAMLKFNSGDRPIYFGTAGEESTVSYPLVEGALFVSMDNGQLWIAKNNAWSLVRHVEFTVEIPFGGPPDSIQLPGVPTSSGVSVTNRPVVALGSQIPTNPIPGVETLLIKMAETLSALLTEMRVQSLMLHQGFGGAALTTDLDQIRAEVLTAEDTLTR